MNFIKSLKKLLTLQNVLFILACLFTVNIICNNNNININNNINNNNININEGYKINQIQVKHYF